MNVYKHGIYIEEQPTALANPAKLVGGVSVIFGTAPVNTVKDPKAAVNKLFLCETFQEAKEAVGYSSDYEKFTICQAMDAFFKIHKVGPIVVCNVLDPIKHNAKYDETVAVVDDQATATTQGVLLEGLTVKDGDSTLTAETDYITSFNDEGYLVLSLLKTGVTSVKLSGNKLDSTKVTAEDIIGYRDENAGTETGFELIRRLFPKLQQVPSFLLAPGWTQIEQVAHALTEKCRLINGAFQATALIDLDTEKAKKYRDVEKVKKDAGYEDSHQILLWPMARVNGKIMYYSAMFAAMSSKLDFDNGNVPNIYPSNKPLLADAAVLKDGTEVDLDNLEGNELNGAGVVTIVNFGGIKVWGNNTACYDANDVRTTIDPKDRWIACRKFFTWWGNNFVVAYLSKVDDNANRVLIQSIVDEENIRGNGIVSDGKAAGIRMEYNPEENTTESIVDGWLKFHQYLALYTPAEKIQNTLEFDLDTLMAELNGGE